MARMLTCWVAVLIAARSRSLTLNGTCIGPAWKSKARHRVSLSRENRKERMSQMAEGKML
ncbi:MAG: hypothetical protein BVN32_00385 [Proteobacteria bacterium ST_bin14]|nr:MAG: hypothetical protein BVN32_00385 [Proteobacteria bacterium ST_bin14]